MTVETEVVGQLHDKWNLKLGMCVGGGGQSRLDGDNGESKRETNCKMMMTLMIMMM